MKMAEMLTGSRKTYGVNLIAVCAATILKEQRNLDLPGSWRIEIRSC